MFHASSLRQLRAFGLERVAVACGVFDGLHRGHRQILDHLLAAAREHAAAPVLMTFDPHPDTVLHPGRDVRLLLSNEHKLALLEHYGLAAVVVLPFDAAMAALPPADFLDHELLNADLVLTDICVGQHWRFGARGVGDVAMLAAYGQQHDFSVHPVPELLDAGEPVSSTRIRTALLAGDLATVRRLLGRHFSILGRVGFGKGIATTDLHYPTANVTPGNEAFPPSGIYAARGILAPEAVGDERRSLPGVVYLGNSPTFVETAPPRPFVEMHIFDFHEDIYGRRLEVEFLAFIRGDRRFPDAASLSAQIARDIEAARRLHATADDTP